MTHVVNTVPTINALDKSTEIYFAIANQWHGRPTKYKPISVTKGMRLLREIQGRTTLPKQLRTRAAVLLNEIIEGNASPLTKQEDMINGNN